VLAGFSLNFKIMARIKYSALVTEIKGSIGGTTFQSNAYGYTIKNKPRQVKPKSQYQNRSKLYLAAAAQQWNYLGSSSRGEWDAWAAANPQYAKNNPSAVLSGFAVFVRVCQQIFLRSGDISDVTVSPSYTIYAVDTPTFTLTRDGGVLTLAYSWVLGETHNRANVFMSQPYKPTVNFAGTRTRFIKNIQTDSDSNDIASEYSSLFGSLPAVGDKIFVDNVQYDQSNGMVYARQSAEVIVEAP
jgi:hypothetical protein